MRPKIPLFRPPILTGKYLHRVLRSRWLTAGPWVEKFREACGRQFGVDHRRIHLAARATSCFQAVMDHLQATMAPDLTYITPSTFPGMHLAIRHAGQRMTHVSGRNVDVAVVTDIGGARLCKEDANAKFSIGTLFVHDACHSGTEWLGHSPDFTLFSCYPTKPIPGGEGGICICPSREIAEELELRVSSGLSTAYGRSPTAPLRPTVAGRETHMTDVQAALNLEALELSNDYMARIEESWNRLAAAAWNLGVPYRGQAVRPYLFQVPLDDINKLLHFKRCCGRHGIPTAWNFSPSCMVTLPCFPRMSHGTAKWIVEKARRILDGQGKKGPAVCG